MNSQFVNIENISDTEKIIHSYKYNVGGKISNCFPFVIAIVILKRGK